MLDEQASSGDRSQLTGIIRDIRKRWRLKLALRGAAFVVGGFVATLLLSAYALEALKFSPGSIIAFRIGMVMILGALGGYFFVLPQWRRVTDEQVALYLEESEPSLETAILSALEAEKNSPSHSPALARRLVEQAIDQCISIEQGRRLEAQPLRRYSTVIGVTIAAALIVFLFGPAYFRQGASALLLMAGDVLEASPYRIDVKPGNATVPRGSDQVISARLQGFESEQAELLIRKSVNAPFERVPMVLNNDTGAFDGLLFDLPGSLDYYIESAGVRSSVFTIHAAELPYVKQMEMEYVFPAYTGLEPRKIENGGDIAVLQGTQVRLRITPTMASPSGRILVDGGSAIALTQEAGVFTATIAVNKDGFYRVELQGGPENKLVNASPQYTIDVLEDQAPTVSIAKPGRDTTASPVEEFAIEARADDDFGVRQLQLVYSVNGGPEQVKTLVDGRNRPLPEVSAAHTFYLEELKLAPGDSVSYFARAVDNDSVRGGKTISSDLYFIRIRKLDEQFRSAMSMGGGGGGGGGQQMQVDALSQQQREIISATHNIVRDRKTMTPQKLRESLVVVGLSQVKLREQVEGLVGRMNSRLVEPDPAFQRIAELLPKAAEEMRAAEAKLQAQAPDGALPPENRALQQLQKVEEEYEKQVGQQSGGGGGGGGAGSVSEDLAELFKQDLDKLANQYETAQSAQQQQSDQQVDALMEKLRELARRQQQEAERQRQQALAGQIGQGGGASQRQLAEQAEEAARQLERLSRERNRPDLAQAAQQMRQAADAMRRAASSGDPGSAGQANAALGQLREAQKRLEQEQTARGERDMQSAQQQAEEIAREHQELASEASSMTKMGGGRSDRARQVGERKYALEAKVNELEKQLDRMSGEMRRDEREASRKLQEAADAIRDNRLEEKIHYTGSLMRQQGQTDTSLEGDIGSEVDGLRRKLAEAANSVGKGDTGDRMTNNLDRARNLVRGVDSMQQQMREGQQSQRGQQGQQGQEGQQGQQGQGQQGQQAQQGQGQGQGQQGQQRQGQQGGQGQQAQNGQGGGSQDGSNRGGDNWGGWGQRAYSPQEVRDFRNQTRYWANEAQGLREQLKADGVNPADLDEILRAMRQLDDDRVYKDAKELERLQTTVAEGLKRFEFTLRRKVEDSEIEQPALTATDEVPRGFRDLVDEYYRSLSRTTSR